MPRPGARHAQVPVDHTQYTKAARQEIALDDLQNEHSRSDIGVDGSDW